jgi:hypothetical protein
MTTPIRTYRTLACATMAAWTASGLLAAAQWKNLPTDTVPRTADGKPNLSAATPRTASGKPDLSGIYTPNYRYFQNLAADLGLDKVPMTEEARKIHTARATGLLGYEEPDAHCLPQGVPKVNNAPVPFKIVQTDKLVVLVYEAFNLWRQVFLDDRQWADDLNPSWMCYSKGRWDGDKLTVIERFRRPTVGRLEIEYTITDPTYYTKPWTTTTNLRLTPDTELFEFVCNENEKSTPHMGPHIK